MIQGNYLNKEQKAIKDILMDGLLNLIENIVNEHKTLFNGTELADLIISIIIIFSRELICNVIENSNIPYELRDNCIKDITNEIHTQCLHRVTGH